MSRVCENGLWSPLGFTRLGIYIPVPSAKTACLVKEPGELQGNIMKFSKAVLGACLLAASTQVQAADVKPGNCAIWAEMTADTVEADPRFAGEADAVASLRAYAEAQGAIVDREMPKTYEQMAAFGYDKAATDAQIAAGEAALRAGFFTPTMTKGTLYQDHVMAVYNCANAAKSADELGQEPEVIVAVLNALSKTVRGM